MDELSADDKLARHEPADLDPLDTRQTGLDILAGLLILAGLIGGVAIWFMFADTGRQWQGGAMVQTYNGYAAAAAVLVALSGLFWGYLLFKLRSVLLNQAEIIQRLRNLA